MLVLVFIWSCPAKLGHGALMGMEKKYDQNKLRLNTLIIYIMKFYFMKKGTLISVSSWFIEFWRKKKGERHVTTTSTFTLKTRHYSPYNISIKKSFGEFYNKYIRNMPSYYERLNINTLRDISHQTYNFRKKKKKITYHFFKFLRSTLKPIRPSL